MKKMRITRKVEFCASHVCAHPDLTPEENRRIYGPAANPNGHGHNYVLEVVLDGEPDPVTGMIVDLKDVKAVVNRHVVEPFDHRHLNAEVKPFDRVVPTVENIAVEIWNRLSPEFSQGRASLAMIRLYETDDLYVEYRGVPS
jgi:6-pyruvoyltetrahydropterin/6-carboxytetrahydropterin synthase